MYYKYQNKDNYKTEECFQQAFQEIQHRQELNLNITQ